MTPDQTLELLTTVYTTYNQEWAKRDEPRLTKVWHAYFKDLEYELTLKAFIDLSMESKFMPTPMDIRKASINTSTEIPPPPLPNLAWATFQTIIKSANNGTHTNTPMHECLKNAMLSLGDAIYTYNNQFDQKKFEAVYIAEVAKFERQKFRMA